MRATSSISTLLLLCIQHLVNSQELEWWQSTVLYQIYPRSFKDSDGDGVGDLKGIEEKLEHFEDAGIGAIWLSPIFESPGVDFGYDISNYTKIDPLFGTEQDLIDLVNSAHDLGIKVLLDLVPNHVSNESEWFINSVQKIDPYTDYFLWADPVIGDDGNRNPPNNWISIFSGSAWEWREERQQYYLHQFAIQQPDLNYRSPVVVEEVKNVIRYWLDRGLDGFRVDAVPHLFENEALPDEPKSGDPNATPNDASYLTHIYTQNQAETFEMVQQWREVVDEYKEKDGQTRILVTEAYAGVEDTFKYFGTDERPGAYFTFNFFLISDLKNTSKAAEFNATLRKWLDNIPEGRWNNWVLGNHDNHRVGSRFNENLIDSLNILIHLLPGTSVTYNGEEIGMVDTFISWEDTVDPAGLNVGPDRYQLFSRDPERTPFQWDNTTNAGFSTAEKTWLPVNENYLTLNLEEEKNTELSHYKVYQELLRLRQTKTIQSGSVNIQVLSEDLLAYSRELENEPTYIVVVNFGDDDATADLTQFFTNLPSAVNDVVSSINSGHEAGESHDPTSIPLPPYAALVVSTSTTTSK